MATKMTREAAAARREGILQAARWCFLNFGFSKTSLDDIAKRASISRTLLYKSFKDKEDIFAAVFADWLVARQPAALEAARAAGSPYERLLDVCRLMVLEPWADMVGAPMAAEFYDVCERLDPGVSANHRRVAHACAAAILGNDSAAEVFLLALDGLLADRPTTAVLEQRVQLLADRFVQPQVKKGRG
ncbi:TetR/AcrR family transcriptional regulator [Ralstonia solanacearum]|uniref:TetR/AcrR family transcriptional regulator n=2 Tax=Ralstonia solanacearum TaxID=305 RepID=UPI000AD983DC|nr:TetR/AcrR family transcriptional regulator [Ralstonia solanacearum]